AKSVECGESCYRNGVGFIERAILSFQSYSVFSGSSVLGVAGVAHTVYFVPWFELSHIIADCFDPASDVASDSGFFWPAQSHTHSEHGQYESYQEGRSSHIIPVCRINGGCVDLYQYATNIVRSRLLHLLQLENVR